MAPAPAAVVTAVLLQSEALEAQEEAATAVVDLDGGLFRGVSGGWLRGAGVATGAAQLRELD